MSDFYSDLNLKGRAAEFLTVAYFNARGIGSSINEATKQDRAGLASHDIVVGGEPWEVKSDWYCGDTKRIFVERASLEYSKSIRFCFWLPSPYGMDMRIFLRSELIGFYNAKTKIR